MNKHQLVQAVAKQAGVTQEVANELISAVVSNITKSVAKGEKVTLVGFGTFDVRHRAPSKGYNIAEKASMEIPAMFVPTFRAGDSLRNAVKTSKKLNNKLDKA